MSSYEQFTIEEGWYGEWRDEVESPDWWRYVCGAELRFDGSGGDDTAANGLRVTWCRLGYWNGSWDDQTTGTIWNGDWGDWKGMKMCPEDFFVSTFNVRFDDCDDCDDTALNGLEMVCRHKRYWDRREEVTVYDGKWGEWRTGHEEDHMFIRGLKVRYEDK